MAAESSCRALRDGRHLDLGGQLAGPGNIDFFVEFVVDHHHRAGAATGKTFDKLDGHLPVGRGFAESAVKLLPHLLTDLVAADQRAGQRPADLDGGGQRAAGGTSDRT